MNGWRFPLLLLVAALVVLVVPSSTSALPPAPQASCSPGPADCGAWHTGNVTVSWSAPSCASATVSQDGGTGVSCTVSDGSGSVTSTVIVRRDASPPAVTASPERGPDNDGWYNRPVAVSVSGDDATSGLAGCSGGGTYSGPDTGGADVGGSCTDNAGNRGSASFGLKFDATPPTVEAKPDRQPNARGWYNRELTVSFNGADATSGLHSCAPAVTYKGPDAPKTAVSGTCMDKAANTSPPAGYELRYDTRPPTLARVKAEITAGGVVLKWKASKDTVTVGVVRRPGLKGKQPSTLYTGKALAFTDRRLTKGVKYRYTVTAYDEAENAAVKGLAVKPDVSVNRPSTPARPAAARPSLTRPAVGARVAAPPVLAWGAVPKATYYNVQLYRDGRKILTVWPASTSFLVQRAWRYEGRSYRLTPGRYRWYVWPGFGLRSANRYGKLVGTRTFVVTR